MAKTSETLRKKDLTITVNDYGYYVISAMIAGQRVENKFNGYTKNEAIARFIATQGQ